MPHSLHVLPISFPPPTHLGANPFAAVFLMVILTPVILSAGQLRKFRAGMVGLWAPLLVLLMDTSNTVRTLHAGLPRVV